MRALLFIFNINDYDFPKKHGKVKDRDNPFVLFSLSDAVYTPIEKFPTRKHASKRLKEMQL